VSLRGNISVIVVEDSDWELFCFIYIGQYNRKRAHVIAVILWVGTDEYINEVVVSLAESNCEVGDNYLLTMPVCVYHVSSLLLDSFVSAASVKKVICDNAR
jgi:hypothetical protein